MALEKEFQFYVNANLHKYEGKYVAIVEDKVVASGDTIPVVLDAARKKTGKEPLIAKIPGEDTLIMVF